MAKNRQSQLKNYVKFGQPIVIFILVLVTLSYCHTKKVPVISSKSLDVLSRLVNAPFDSTETIQKLLDERAKVGGKVLLPPGRFMIAGQLNIPETVTLEGSWEGSVHYLTTKKNTVLMITGRRGAEDFAEKGAIHLNASSGLKGLTIAYPEQEYPDIVPYPWTITGDGYSIHIENVTLINSYQGIRLGYIDSTLHYIRNVFGTVLRRGLWIDNCFDVGRIENVHFNVIWWSKTAIPGKVPNPLPNIDQVLANYTRKHLEAFILNRSDWSTLKDTFVYGAKIGYRFPASEELADNFTGRMIGIAADGCVTCMSFENANPYGIKISDGTFVSHLNFDPTKEMKDVTFEAVDDMVPNNIVTTISADSPIQFNNCSFFGYYAHIAFLEGKGFITFNQCLFRSVPPCPRSTGWNFRNEEDAAIHALNGKLGISHSQFLEWPGTKFNSVYLGKNVSSAKIIGNLSSSKVRVKNKIGKQAVIDFND